MTLGRIAITGVGMTTALGRDAETTFSALVRGDRGFSEVSLFDVAGQRSLLAAEVRGFTPGDEVPPGSRARWSRSDALALVAARDALRAAGEPRSGERLGIAVGVTTGGMLEAEALLAAPLDRRPDASAPHLLSYPLSSTADRLGEALSVPGPVATICSACSSSANALVQAAAWLRNGAAERVLAGGTDALCRLTFTGFNALGATDRVACRPFDRDREGLTLGEGAAFLVLELEETAVRRGAHVVAWLSGWAVSAEAHHITQPEPSGRSAAAAIAAALRRAGLGPETIDYVNAHGTGTASNDAVETLALHQVFGPDHERVFVSSAKGQLGHTLGAAGAIEAAVTVLALAHGRVPPTGGLVTPDPACRLRHVPGRGVAAPLRAAVSSSFGFGGTGTVLVFERADAAARPSNRRAPRRIAITGVSTISPRGVAAGDACTLDASPPVPRLQWSALDLLDPERSRRFDSFASFATVGAKAALESAGYRGPDASRAGLVVGTAFGNVDRPGAFLRAAFQKGPRRVPPAEFPHLLPSSASGNASIYLGLTGPVLSTCDLEATAEAAVHLASEWLEAGEADVIVAGSGDPHDELSAQVLGPACEVVSGLPRAESGAWVVLETEASARTRGDRPLVILRNRYVVPRASLEAVRFAPPGVAGKRLVLSVRDPALLAPALFRSGWGEAETRSIGAFTGFNEGATGHALALAVTLIRSGDAGEVLVAGWNERRLYVFHLTSSG